MESQKHILHWSPRSPFVKKVVIAAHELGAASRLEHIRSVVPTDNPQHPIFNDNPLGKIPTLVSPDGEKVHGSSLILEYFDALIDAGEWPSEVRMFPLETSDRLKVRQIEIVCDEMLQRLIAWMMEWYFPTVRSRAKYANSKNKIDRGLDYLAQEIEWMVESGVNAATIATACTLSYLDFRFSRIVEWRDNRAGLADWHDEFSQRQSMQHNPFQEG